MAKVPPPKRGKGEPPQQGKETKGNLEKPGTFALVTNIATMRGRKWKDKGVFGR